MKKVISVVLLTLCICFGVYGACSAESDSVELTVLMYHNILPDTSTPTKYEIRSKDFDADLDLIEKNGYSFVSVKELVEYTENRRDLPKKCVLVTFDDGYYNNALYIPEILERHGAKAVISVVGEYTALNKENPKVSERFTYLDFGDMVELDEDPNIEIGLHSYNLHHISKARKGAAINRGEEVAAYEEMFRNDTDMLIKQLGKVGIRSNIYAYPYGNFCRESEYILKTMGIKCTLSCTEGTNVVTRDPSSLFLLKRYNRDGRRCELDKILDIAE